MKKILIKKMFNHNTKKSIFLKKFKKFKKFKKILYPLSKPPLLSLEKFWSFGGGLDKGFYGIYICFFFK